VFGVSYREASVSIDWVSEIGKATAARLRHGHVGWLTTVGARFTPYPSPVWYWWDGGDILVYSRPDTTKLRNVAARPAVTLGLQVDAIGEQFSVVTGRGRIDPTHGSAAEHAGYRAKYEYLIRQVLDQTPEEFAADYSVPVLVTPETCRGL
jgi:PPOX class probable F420-dependent enzyme